MNNKLIYIILIYFFIIMGCNYPNESYLEVEEYYPMRIGNQWEYITKGPDLTEKIIDTVRVHGKLFFGFTRRSEEPEYWMRESNGQIYYLNLNDSTEFLLYNFTPSIGTHWEVPSAYGCSFGLGLTLVGKTDTIVTSVDTFYNCYHFRHQKICEDGGIFDTWLVKGIGKVKYSYETFFSIEDRLLNNYDITD